ncbi:MAG: biopolymer transporter ExbD [Acidobacteria bacterium]|nr:biopolymer transporter ExbD [Acidobacteriota bacterium]
MSMVRAGARGGAMSEPNITPLIDVMLVLIIIFMVINPPNPLGLDALVPQPNPNAEPPSLDVINRTVVVSIGDEYPITHKVKINQDEVDIRLLGQRLEDIFKTRSERVMFVRGADSLPFGDVAAVIDVAKGAGIDKIGLMTQKIESENR